MKEILISIQPQWVEKILNGEKTIEIRKTMPKCKLPCKVYIYSSKSKDYLLDLDYTGIYFCWNKKSHHYPFKFHKQEFGEELKGNHEQKVVAEFTLNEVDFIKMPINLSQEFMSKSCLNGSEIMEYLGGNFYKDFYAWHIDNLKIYDRPKELSEFRKDLDCDDYPCNKNRDCKYNYYDHSEGCWACGIDFDGSNCIYKQLKRPPQSWCYVESICQTT